MWGRNTSEANSPKKKPPMCTKFPMYGNVPSAAKKIRIILFTMKSYFLYG